MSTGGVTMRPGQAFGWLATAVVGILLVVAIVVGMAAGCQSFNRYQARANANNQVAISSIEIRNQAQRVIVTKQQADIRYQEAVGLRRAQDEVRKTLTPLYVEFQLVQALQAIATSGTNDTVIYLPTDPKSGLPIVPVSNTSPVKVKP